MIKTMIEIKQISDIKDQLLVGVINNISFAFPSFPLLTQPKDIREDLFCDEKHKLPECRTGKRCHCLRSPAPLRG